LYSLKYTVECRINKIGRILWAATVDGNGRTYGFEYVIWQGRGTVVTGRIEQGVVKVGDEVEIVGLKPVR
jgi:GTPase